MSFENELQLEVMAFWDYLIQWQEEWPNELFTLDQITIALGITDPMKSRRMLQTLKQGVETGHIEEKRPGHYRLTELGFDIFNY